MKLTLRSSGGFTGPAGAVARTVDLDKLPAEQRKEGQSLVDAAHLFDRPATSKLASPKPWDFNHVLDIDDGARKHRIELHLDAVDAPLRALVAWLGGERDAEPTKR
jgi:hypothetical protein